MQKANVENLLKEIKKLAEGANQEQRVKLYQRLVEYRKSLKKKHTSIVEANTSSQDFLDEK